MIWAALVLLLLLIVLSIAGAFMGSVSARRLFNSPPLVACWVVFALLLIVAFTVFKGLWRQSSLLMLHVGPVLILAGAMLGSGPAHKLAAKYFGMV